MKHNVLVVHAEKCTGCRVCEQWCSQTHEGEVNPAKARLTIHRDHDHQSNVPTVCLQCTNARCLEACPTDCISRNEAYGLVVEIDCCLGCRICLDSCLRGCIRWDVDQDLPVMCDLCDGDPQCVKHCPEGAIEYVSADGRTPRQQTAKGN